jgi:peptidoglycan/LPS O-acetylase OafA/YrhL
MSPSRALTTLPAADEQAAAEHSTGSPARPSPGGRRSQTRPEPPPPRGFRPDIEGLRAIAVVTVVLYHAHLLFPGGYVGVDVFFVISGFLITRQVVRSVGDRGALALPAFYAHRVRRLLPAAAVVTVATLLVTRFWAPALQVRDIAVDAVFTTFYGLNYRLAAQGLDYQHVGVAASPLQHFWSLAVEEQFYLLWPALVLAGTLLARRRARLVLGVLVAGVVAWSAYESVVVTHDSAPWAYFSLHTRAWELGLGALVALASPRLTALPRRLAGLAAWAGIAAIVASAVLYTDATPFPGVAAWAPVAGTALVIAVGCGPRVGAERTLGEPLMQCLGKVSYSWYLWHWPMLVLAPHVVGHDLSVVERCAVVWLSLLAAILSFFLVEEPARRLRLPSWRWVATGAAISGLVAASSVAVLHWGPSLVGSGAATRIVALPEAAGGTDTVRTADDTIAAAVRTGLDTRAAPSNLTPAPADAADSLPASSRNGCHAAFTQVDQGACVYGDPTGARTIALFGDSHMEQWLPGIDKAARRTGWRVVSWTKSACPPAALTVFNPTLNRTYTECDEWRTRTIARLGELHPDQVVVGESENVASSDVSPATFAEATLTTLRAVESATGVRPEFMLDIPIPGTDLPGCVAAHLDDVSQCSFEFDRAYSYPDRHAALVSTLRDAGIRTTDPAPWLCTSESCPPVVGNVLVYRNDSHITVPYSTWLAPVLRPLLRKE